MAGVFGTAERRRFRATVAARSIKQAECGFERLGIAFAALIVHRCNARSPAQVSMPACNGRRCPIRPFAIVEACVWEDARLAHHQAARGFKAPGRSRATPALVNGGI